MQRKLFSRFAFAVAIITTVAPQSVRADTKRDVQVKTSDFYRWYVGQLKHSRDPISQRATMQKYISHRLTKWLYSPTYREYGADYFIDAQDFDADWDNVRTQNFRLRGNAATLTAILGRVKSADKSIGARTLRLKWRRENGAWKLDRVNDH